MSKTRLYPLKFETIFKEKIWGGQKINSVLGKDFSPLKNCGETWELSGVQGNISIVKNGPYQGSLLTDLIDQSPEDILGQKVYSRFGNKFPLLIKFLDANQDLSIQVHPDDEMAQKKHNGFGKTEMWYVIQADEGSKLITGFNQPVDKKQYLESIREGKLMDILNIEIVNSGDVFFIPAGRVHTIGKGLLIAEIQQTSDITYRIYDFDRTDEHGNKRELHTDLAVDAIDYRFQRNYRTDYAPEINTPVELVNCEYFVTRLLELDHSPFTVKVTKDSFKILIVVEGQAELVFDKNVLSLKMGDVVLLPACIGQVELNPDHRVKLLETFINNIGQ